MRNFIFPLTEDESKDNSCKGWKYINDNYDRLVEYTDEIYENWVAPGYSREVTRFVYNDKVYKVIKDYIDVSRGDHIFIVVPSTDGHDLL